MNDTEIDELFKGLEEYKKEVDNAIQEFEKFRLEHSRDLTEEEKEEHKNETPIFLGVETNDEPKIFELSFESVDEYKKLEQNIRDKQKILIGKLKEDG